MNHTAGPEGRQATVKTYFEIAGDDFDPAACTRQLGLQPTDFQIKGEVGGKYGLTARVSTWSIHTGDQPAVDLDLGLQTLLATLWPIRDPMHRFVAGWRSPLSVAIGSIVKIRHDVPEYHLPPDTIARLAAMEAEYWPDIYDFRSPKLRGGAPGGMDPEDPMPFVTTYCEISGSELDPAAFAGAIGLPPGETKVEAGQGWWRLALKDQRGYNTEDGLKALLDTLWPVRDPIAQLIGERPATITFGSSVRMYFDNLVYGLTQPTLHRLAALGAHYLLDIQDFRA
jgi:hypothetical protein